MRVLVTGADGFVGAHLLDAFRSRGDVVLSCGGPGGRDGLEITDGNAVRARFETFRPEAVVHLAGVSSVARSHEHPTGTVLVNVIGAMNVLEAARTVTPGARVLLVGSGEEYGRLDGRTPVEETASLAPLSPYAASKAAAEVLARQMAHAYGLAVVLARPFNHLGRGQASSFVVPSFARQLAAIKRGETPQVLSVGDLSPVRDFSHVEDVVAAYLLLLAKGVPGEAYNVCSGRGFSIEQILEELQRLAGTHAAIQVDAGRLRPAEIPWLVGSAAKLEALGWSRRRTVEAALAEVLTEHGA